MMRKFTKIICIVLILYSIFCFLSFIKGTWAQTEGVTVTVTVAYTKEVHQVDTTQSFTEDLSNPNGSSFEINSPTDALSSGEEIEMTMYSTPEEAVTDNQPLPSGKLGADIFYNISFEKVSDGSQVTSFDKAITLIFNYIDDDISGIDEGTLRAYRWSGSEWVALSDSTVDTAINKVTATNQQFSDFALLGDASPSCGNGVKEENEQCDGSDLGGETCASRGFTGGTLSCKADCTFDTSACTTGGGGGGGGYISPTPQTVVKFNGKAYPKTSVTLLKDAQIAATTVAGSDANFQISLSGLSAGNYIFSLYSEDKEGRRSSLLTFPISVTKGATTNVSGIFIAPTIDVDKSEVKRGENIAIFGQSAPQGEITIVVSSEQDFFVKTKTDEDGVYLYNFDTSPLEMRQHFAKSKAALNGEVSSFSKSVGFIIGTKTVLKEKPEISKGDVNNDNRVNLVDFSITAYWYKRSSPPSSVDLNSDGKVDLVDFSIMAFYWTG